MRALTQDEFLKTSAGAHAQSELQLMVKSISYDTNASNNSQAGRGLVFVDRHLSYMAKHPDIAPSAYLSNLRVMTKKAR
jgi:hypothetical protein